MHNLSTKKGLTIRHNSGHFWGIPLGGSGGIRTRVFLRTQGFRDLAV